MNPGKAARGFTQIELSIVLVIIGLIIGGVLAGRDLISASEVRAQLSQIERIQTAVNTFQGKFGYLPGDIPATSATLFGLPNPSCAGTAGLRDGNHIIEGTSGTDSMLQGSGETGLFWSDLSSAAAGSLIEGTFSTAVCNSPPTLTSYTGYALYFPTSKLAPGNYLYAFSYFKANYIGMSNISTIAAGDFYSYGSIPVMQAYKIDQKMDDGIPLTGKVVARYVTNEGVLDWVKSMRSAPADQWICFDSTDVIRGSYAIAVNNGRGANCGLSFRLQ